MHTMLITEVREIQSRAMRYLAVLGGALALVFLVSLEGGGASLTFSGTSLAAQTLLYLEETLVPAGVSLVVLDPFAPFAALVGTGFFLAFLLTLPYLAYLTFGYVLPALTTGERRGLGRWSAAASILFCVGVLFALGYVIPATFSVLYGFAPDVGAAPLFSLGAFLSAVFLLSFVTGVLFLLPVGMAALARAGLVSPRTWRAHWRVAVISFLVVSAILTPDGSGVTMLLLAVPMSGLYGVGLMASGRVHARHYTS